jgi:hypothetical protein
MPQPLPPQPPPQHHGVVVAEVEEEEAVAEAAVEAVHPLQPPSQRPQPHLAAVAVFAGAEQSTLQIRAFKLPTNASAISKQRIRLLLML